MDENEIFEILTRHDAKAVDHVGAAVDVMRVYCTLDRMKELVEAVYYNQLKK